MKKNNNFYIKNKIIYNNLIIIIALTKKQIKRLFNIKKTKKK